MVNATKGFKALNKRLDNIHNNLGKNVEKLGEDVINVGYEVARSKVPVDDGDLKDSITKTKTSLNVGAEHGVYVEYGTYKTPAQPYYRPAVEEMEKYLKEHAGDVVNES